MQAEFDASELITQREVVSQRVSELLTDRGETFGLILDDISIVSPPLFAQLLEFLDQLSLLRLAKPPKLIYFLLYSIYIFILLSIVHPLECICSAFFLTISTFNDI